MSEHDSPYNLLFSHKQMITDLFRGFVKEPWIEDMDLTTLEDAERLLISEGFQRREGDKIWRLKFRDGWLYVYLFLEFQSTVDKFMALRMLVYIGLFHQTIIRMKQLTSRGGWRLEAVGWRKRDVSLRHMLEKGIFTPRRRVCRFAGFGGQSGRARAPET